MHQTTLFNNKTLNKIGIFPKSRYQGSKYKLTEWIKYHTKGLDFKIVLDAFGGTSAIAYMFKQMGKRVFCNDILRANYYIGLALIENNNTFLDKHSIEFVLTQHNNINYPTFIADTFQNIYYTDEENKWLDIIITNIRQIENKYKQAMLYWALFQACIIKRPYNLFHRKNLYIRLNDVKRTFGNKTTWDTPFETHFRKFVHTINDAIFDNRKDNLVFNKDIFKLELEEKIDLVYIDTPYISANGVGVNYYDFYHFLEGIVNYDNWSKMIDYNSKHKKLKSLANTFDNKNKIIEAFDNLFHKFKDNIIVISYRKDGLPSYDILYNLLSNYKKNISVFEIDYKYVLSNKNSKEILFIANS